MRHTTGGLNKWSTELTRLSQRSVAVSHSIIDIAVSYGNSTNLTYADDLVILAPSHVGLSMLLSVCSDYGLEHDIKSNSAKSNIMIFCCKTFNYIHVPSFELNDIILPRVNQCKYIGHVITDDLKDDNDIARQYKRMYAQGNTLVRKLYMCSDHVKCTLFR